MRVNQVAAGYLSRFNIVRTKLIDNETTPLQIGNGNFAFNVDNTGMQTFLPFNTLSSWAWHNDSLPADGCGKIPAQPNSGRRLTICSELPSDYHGVPRETYGRQVYYDALPDPNLKQATQWLIGNPNRINLGRIGLTYKGATVSASQITQPKQVQDLWNGIITSTFEIDGKYVKVITQGDFEEDAVAFRVESELLKSGDLGVELDFPYPPIHTTAYKYEVSECDLPSELALRRNPSPPSTIQKRNKLEWNKYWQEGGFVDVTASSNLNATELRRIVTSQYHVRVNSAANGQSPQESGLMNNGWYGKFHMEMVIWHNAHWATWGKQKYFDNIFPELYERLLPSSLARAKAMGWQGARWPKMTDPIYGINSPGDINGVLLWQQPHPMYLANLAYQASPTRKTLERWDRVLTETANYMASYAGLNNSTGKYDLGPPSYGVTENTPPNSTRNLAYEIAYWRYGLDAAREWKHKLGQRIPEKWTHVAANLALPPQVDGLYAVYNGLNSSWWNDTKLTGDPRSLIMLQGILPDTPAVDPKIALATAEKVAQVWTDDKIRGWGRPVLAINSARIGNPSRAMYHLTAYDYWKFDDAGFAIRGGDGGTPPPFMPGNAGFLYAVAYVVGGWSGSKGDAPGVPKGEGLVVKHEGLMKAL
ncbi:uncharacterized protein N0V89_010364 [Didymosphaeria variabile]|uniref:Six-hairpin glycosidase n=1 Tax=Didymosphaeria variabile TaxID=1932322 RepID=A0A9W8XBH8_9PLEO|nr:uncharacterized protein N0V89_010364 [Didymosphaeria variabile]KAJ4346435.1 hypothetical protein N0V89_010364 [Didymosphaeria variabile]